MAFAIMGGLLVATLLTLVFVPVLYVTWYRGEASATPDGAGAAQAQ
jgi:Cu/Ag efflux pump CusA